MNRLAFSFLLILSGLLSVPVFTYAQSLLDDVGSTLTIQLTPENVAPGQVITVELSNFSRDFSLATVAWSVDGKIVASGLGLTTTTVQAGSLGSQKRVAVAAQFPDGSILSGSTTLTPSVVSLVWEAETYTPPWYRGKALASPGSVVRASAEAWFIRKDGSRISNDQILFSWKRNGILLTTLSGVGKSTLTMPAPQLHADDSLSVTASSRDGSFEGNSIVVIPSASVQPVLYPTSPTGGVSYISALGESVTVIDSETTVVAELYFASIRNRNDAQMQYQWSVNGEVSRPESEASKLTIALANTGAVTAKITLAVNHAANSCNRGNTRRIRGRNCRSACERRLPARV
jgi:hypothetical protein